jgi:hypothetical protein
LSHIALHRFLWLPPVRCAYSEIPSGFLADQRVSCWLAEELNDEGFVGQPATGDRRGHGIRLTVAPRCRSWKDDQGAAMNLLLMWLPTIISTLLLVGIVAGKNWLKSRIEDSIRHEFDQKARSHALAGPCTHKSRWVSGGCSMSALPPKVDIKGRNWNDR